MPRILFIHENFPAQFGGIAQSLLRQGWDVLFATAADHIPDDNAVHVQGAGLRVVRYRRARERSDGTHRYLHSSEHAVLNAQGFARLAGALRKGGYSPDIIIAHSGWGSGSLAKVAWPRAKFVQYLEWWYNYPAPDIEPHAQSQNPEDTMARTLCRNLPFLLDAQSADTVLVPTQFQAQQLPDLLKPITVVQHDGVSCDFFKPDETSAARFELDGLPQDAPVLTYATRGMEPLRGFPQFMAAAARLQKEFPDLHVLIAGTDTVHYGPQQAKGHSFKTSALKQNHFDKDRLHFLGRLPKSRYRDLLQRSTVHVYLTRPFVMSWSFIEAMACGCAIVTAQNDATQEFATDGQTALLADMDDIDQISAQAGRLLKDPSLRQKLGDGARNLAIKRYSQRVCHTELSKVFTRVIG